VIDYEERNLAIYGRKAGDIPLVSFQWAPYLPTKAPIPIADRPIDILFYGSVNLRRKAILSRIEACGWKVSMFDHLLSQNLLLYAAFFTSPLPYEYKSAQSLLIRIVTGDYEGNYFKSIMRKTRINKLICNA
jgi:hypothetical protein